MADLLPVDTTSPAGAALAPSDIARLDVTLPQLEAELQEAAERQARYLRIEAEHAAEAGLTVDEYRDRGQGYEWHHQLDDPAVPYLILGGQS